MNTFAHLVNMAEVDVLFQDEQDVIDALRRGGFIHSALECPSCAVPTQFKEYVGRAPQWRCPERTCRKRYSQFYDSFFKFMQMDVKKCMKIIVGYIGEVTVAEIAREVGVNPNNVRHFISAVRQMCAYLNEEHEFVDGSFEILLTPVKHLTSVNAPPNCRKQCLFVCHRQSGQVMGKVFDRLNEAEIVEWIRDTIPETSLVFTEEHDVFNELTNWYSHTVYDYGVGTTNELLMVGEKWATVGELLAKNAGHLVPLLNDYLQEAVCRNNKGAAFATDLWTEIRSRHY